MEVRGAAAPCRVSMHVWGQGAAAVGTQCPQEQRCQWRVPPQLQQEQLQQLVQQQEWCQERQLPQLQQEQSQYRQQP